MKIFELNPIDPSARHWEASHYCGRLLIRAESEGSARSLAHVRLQKTVSKPYNGEQPYPPWRHADLVSCVVVTDSGYDDDGDKGILEPVEYSD